MQETIQNRIRLPLSEMELGIATRHAEQDLDVPFPAYVAQLIRNDLLSSGVVSIEDQTPTPSEARDLCIWLRDLGGSKYFFLIYTNERTSKVVSLDSYIEYLSDRQRYRKSSISTNEIVCRRLRMMKARYSLDTSATPEEKDRELFDLASKARDEIK
jgi:hypothetical protein